MISYSSLMKKTLLSLSIASIATFSANLLAEQAEPTAQKRIYHEPTRGFFIEHGMVASTGEASVEIYSGSDDISTGGGIRLGLPNSELILNSGTDDYDEDSALLKWGLPRQNAAGTQQTPLLWSVLVGLGHLDIDNKGTSSDITRTNIKLGVAATLKADAGTFTATPKIIYADIDDSTGKDDDTFFELDLGAYVGLIETEAGLFSAGVEAQITTQDDADNTIALGARWLYNERLNIDVVPFIFSDGDIVGIPGLVRLNVTF